MTGCDRVMAYRFLDDDSGEVVAEARRDDLVPYLHQRYPAGDIPPQARRLYVLSPIRQISSIAAIPVALEPSLNSPPDARTT
jgi:chemotaxis family two-component system sensor kinase Cph1